MWGRLCEINVVYDISAFYKSILVRLYNHMEVWLEVAHHYLGYYFVYSIEEGDGVPIADVWMVPEFWNEYYFSTAKVWQHATLF